MKRIDIDFNDNIYRETGILMDSLATREEWVENAKGERFRLVVLKATGKGGNRFFISAYNVVSEPLTGLSVHSGGRSFYQDPDTSRDGVAVSGLGLGHLGNVELKLKGEYLCTLCIVLELFSSLFQVPDPDEIRDAWMLHAGLRTCPPDRLLFDTDRDVQIRGHILGCPSCRDRLDMKDLNAWKTMAENLASVLPKPTETGIETGQIWSVAQQLSGWGEKLRYYNSPHVIVLERKNDDLWKVAMVCPEPLLIAPDDILLSEAMGFAEPWNLMDLPARHLEKCWGRIDADTVDLILRPAKKGIGEEVADPVLSAFRRLEVDARRFFLNRSTQLRQSTEPTKREIIQMFPGIQLPGSADDLRELLAGAQFPDDYYRKAADDSVGQVEYAKLVTRRGDQLIDCQLLPVEIEELERHGKVTYHGFFPDVRPEIQKASLFCYLDPQEGARLVEISTVKWDAVNQTFEASVDRPPDGARFAVVLEIEK